MVSERNSFVQFAGYGSLTGPKGHWLEGSHVLKGTERRFPEQQHNGEKCFCQFMYS